MIYCLEVLYKCSLNKTYRSDACSSRQQPPPYLSEESKMSGGLLAVDQSSIGKWSRDEYIEYKVSQQPRFGLFSTISAQPHRPDIALWKALVFLNQYTDKNNKNTRKTKWESRSTHFSLHRSLWAKDIQVSSNSISFSRVPPIIGHAFGSPCSIHFGTST